jgi:tRNA dimethylallyltransferase
MNKTKRLLVIQGPTASGKTALAIALAKKFQTVVFSGDSRQFYREMEIGTAKPNKQEQDGIPHFFIDSHSITTPVTASDFEKEALLLLEEQFQKHDVIVLVGGSGLFIDALCYGLDDLPHDATIRAKWNTFFEEKGLEYLQEKLREKDPISFSNLDIQNPVRLIRALEVMEISGLPFSTFHTASKKERPFEILKFVIDLPRELLYERINTRVDNMLKNGLLEEVKSLLSFRDLQVMKTVGYAEFYPFFEGEISLEEATELVKRNTRRYAKRQLTWFRRDENNTWLTSLTTDKQVLELEKNLGTIIEK